MKTDNFSPYVDIFLPGILGLQIPQSLIPGLKKGIRDFLTFYQLSRVMKINFMHAIATKSGDIL